MVFRNGYIYTRDGCFVKKDLYLNGEYIGKKESTDIQREIDIENYYVIPGLIDIHLHGADGADLCDASCESLKRIANYEAQNGVLSIVPTTMTLSEKHLNRICEVVREFEQYNKTDKMQADILGIRLEGPFLSAKKIGAQKREYLCKPSANLIKTLQNKANGNIKIIDIAPELEGATEFIQEMKTEYKLSLAHSDADYETACYAFDSGLTHMTHMFNAMKPIHHREPGPILAAYEKGAEVELICDGIHVHPSVVRMALDLFRDNLMLVSDSMRACGLPDGEYDLGEQLVLVNGNRACMKQDNQVLAGSVTNLFSCMIIAVKEMGIPFEKVIKTVTINPAKALGIDEMYGTLEDGHFANLLILDGEYNLKGIIHKGHILKLEL